MWIGLPLHEVPLTDSRSVCSFCSARAHKVFHYTLDGQICAGTAQRDSGATPSFMVIVSVSVVPHRGKT